MNYMQETNAWLDSLQITDDKVRNEIKDKILESYHNGKEHGKKRKSSGLKKTSGLKKIVDAVSKEVMRQATYTSPKRKYTKKYTKPSK